MSESSHDGDRPDPDDEEFLTRRAIVPHGADAASAAPDRLEVENRPESTGGRSVFGLVGRAPRNAFKLGREMGGSAQRITRQMFTEAEHLVDVALNDQQPSEVVHGEVVEQPRRDDDEKGMSRAELRTRGDRLLARSAAAQPPHGGNRPHPAFEHILSQITPDEARIMRLLHLEGPQPAIDVRATRAFGVGGQTVAAGLSMISEEAGCREDERIAAHLGNLYRLGLIWFSKEQVAMERYELLQVQPVVVDAVNDAGRSAKTVRRRIEITPFGTEFCQTCFSYD